MSFDLDVMLRRLKPLRRTTPLSRRSDQELSFVENAPPAGGEIMLDTCVYIDVLQGRSPDGVADLLRKRACNHSAICLGELTHLLGRLHPDHPGTAKACAEVSRVIADIPKHRLAAPSLRALAEGGVLAGLLTRLAGEQAQPVYNDAVLFLHALEQGQILVTRNIRDFDFLQQLVPAGRVLFYRQV
mgnify:CR=1 FL=1